MKGKVLKTAATAAVLCVFAIGGYVLKMWQLLQSAFTAP
jgi:hypothetical protein